MSKVYDDHQFVHLVECMSGKELTPLFPHCAARCSDKIFLVHFSVVSCCRCCLILHRTSQTNHTMPNKVPVEVIARFRPTNAATETQSDELRVSASSATVHRDSEELAFSKVFTSNADSAQVYETSFQPLVLSWLNGTNATIFAFGQTGELYCIANCLHQAHHEQMPELSMVEFCRFRQDIFASRAENPSKYRGCC